MLIDFNFHFMFPLVTRNLDLPTQVSHWQVGQGWGIESDFGFLAQRDGVARPGGVPAHTFERKKPPILRLSGGAGQLVAPPGRAGPGAGRLGGSLGGRPGAGRRTRRLSRKSTGSSSSPQGLLEALVLGHVRGVCNRANFGRSSLE